MYKHEPYLRNVVNLSDARFAASEAFMGLSFQMDPSKDSYLSPKEIAELRQWISGPLAIGSFSDANLTLLNDAIERLDLDGVEIPNDTAIETIRKIDGLVVLRCTPSAILRISKEKLQAIDYVLLDTNLERLRWQGDHAERIREINKSTPIIVDIGEIEEEKSLKLDELSIYGVAMEGGREAHVGIRSYENFFLQLERLKY